MKCEYTFAVSYKCGTTQGTGGKGGVGGHGGVTRLFNLAEGYTLATLLDGKGDDGKNGKAGESPNIPDDIEMTLYRNVEKTWPSAGTITRSWAIGSSTATDDPC